eukprot:scaffold6995_cov19-Tisochrysis_lutea.AAC.5
MQCSRARALGQQACAHAGAQLQSLTQQNHVAPAAAAALAQPKSCHARLWGLPPPQPCRHRGICPLLPPFAKRAAGSNTGVRPATSTLHTSAQHDCCRGGQHAVPHAAHQTATRHAPELFGAWPQGRQQCAPGRGGQRAEGAVDRGKRWGRCGPRLRLCSGSCFVSGQTCCGARSVC